MDHLGTILLARYTIIKSHSFLLYSLSIVLFCLIPHTCSILDPLGLDLIGGGSLGGLSGLSSIGGLGGIGEMGLGLSMGGIGGTSGLLGGNDPIAKKLETEKDKLAIEKLEQQLELN